jgi:hypothetical protein
MTPSSPPPGHDGRARGLSPDERREAREVVLTFVPPVLIAFVLRWALVTNAGWSPRRALLAGIGVGIVLAVLVQRSLRRQGRP